MTYEERAAYIEQIQREAGVTDLMWRNRQWEFEMRQAELNLIMQRWVLEMQLAVGLAFAGVLRDAEQKDAPHG